MARAALSTQSGRLTGTVWDRNGDSIPFARISVLGTDMVATADRDGRYLLESIPVGTYDVRAAFVGYRPDDGRAVAIGVDSTSRLDFFLTPVVGEGPELGVVPIAGVEAPPEQVGFPNGARSCFRGWLRDAYGKPLVGTEVRFEGTSYFGTTDRKGRFAFDWSPVGDRNIRITAPGYGTLLLLGVAFTRDSLTRLDLILPSAAILAQERHPGIEGQVLPAVRKYDGRGPEATCGD